MSSFREAVHIGMLRGQCPIEPTGLVVLTVRVIVTVLRAPHFVAHQDHGQAQRKHRTCQEVLHLPVPQVLHGSVISWALNAAVPASIVIRAVAVAFAIRLIVLQVIGDQVIKCEPVVARNKLTLSSASRSL